MASIRLFGRGRNAAAAGEGPAAGAAVGAAAIADALDALTSASMSTTWRCRHGAGVSIGEGAVDFAAGRSRSTVIRGKYAFEYVRSGASVFRAKVEDLDPDAGGGAGGAGAGVEDDGEADEALDAEDVEAEAPDDQDDGDEPEAADEGEPEAFDGESESARVQPGSQSAEPEAVAPQPVSQPESVWERFSDHDACGVHAYAEPAVLAAGVRAAGVVQARGTQEFDGTVLAAYTVTLKPKPADPNRVLARLARQLRDHGANTLLVTAYVDQWQRVGLLGLDGEDPEQDTDADADGDGEGERSPRIVRLRIELPHWTPADDPTADHTVSVDLFEFGDPVSVQVPGGGARRRARSCADLALF